MPFQKKNRSLPHKRLVRHAKVASAAIGVGARLTARRVMNTEDTKEDHAEILRHAFGQLKGPLMKVAQMLGTIPDLVPLEYEVAFAQLQMQAPSMGPAFVRRRMAAELGQEWQKNFRTFDIQASAAASLGQVHRAVSCDGKILACKLQYPDMDSAVEADLQQLKIILSFYERFDRSVGTRDIQKEIADHLRLELDYKQEARHISCYQEMLKKEEAVYVPTVEKSLSTSHLLSMTWLEGEPFLEAANTRSQEERNDIAARLYRAWYLPFYQYGLLHGDPHFGNYTIRRDGGVNLLDFGCVRLFTPKLVRGSVLLYRAIVADDKELAIEAYKAWGFKKIEKALLETLNLWARFIYAPVLEDKERALDETNTGVYGREIARKIHNDLRKIGGVVVPREFVFIDRAAVGLGSAFLRLRSKLNWYRLFNELIDDFEEDHCAMQQKSVFKLHQLA